ncbi:unnamed protein product [Polarella glacialis]|uniref:Nucleolar complex protein 2 homolog n=1 Tax=Polarella glacialis TaxID=89957 RepID=A0A813H9X6_POLGL|nr:unnamed protein product [Polarella glacialis]CAE8634703.1 unnamed protein product [Polarella glacialis]
MGFSKKGSKNKQKNDKSAGSKHKKKVKLGKQIEGRNKVKASKKGAARHSGRGDAETKADSVDELFASLGDEDGLLDEEEVGGDGDADDASSCSDSSAGAFQDVEDGDDLGIEDLDALDEGGGKKGGTSEAQRHEKEMRAIKERDPEFYKFLVEQDKQLLDFRADEVRGRSSAGPDDDDLGEGEEEEREEDDEEDFAAVQAGDRDQAAASGRLLTLERFKQIEASASTSFTAFKAALNAYHTAVRSIEGAPEAEGDFETQEVPTGDKEGQVMRQKQVQKQRKSAEKERNKSAASRRRTQRSLMTIDGEATFSEILEWSIANLPVLLRQYGGMEQQGAAAVGAKKDKKAKFKGRGKKGGKATAAQEAAEAEALSAAGLFDPTQLEKWRRIKVLGNIFWDETLFLLTHLAAPAMLEYVLKHVSSPEALCWLWPFKHLRKRYLRRCCSLWALGGPQTSQSVRLLAFLFIRNTAAMAKNVPSAGGGGRDSEVPQLELLMKNVLRAFSEAASTGYSWRSLSNFRFMENCILELFRVDDATAYRVGYVCIRQLALILRNASVATSQGTSTHSKGGSSTKSLRALKKKRLKEQKQKLQKKSGKAQKQQPKSGKKKSSTQLKQVEALVSWPFVRAIYLWTKAVGSVPALRPLAYPLSMITTGAVKSRLSSLQHFPFVFHGLHCLNQLSVSLQAFVPVSSHLLKSLTVLLQAMEKEKKRPSWGEEANYEEENGGSPDAYKKGATVAKAPEVQVLLHFAQGQVFETLTHEAVGSSLFALFTDHLGLLSRSAAFPEVVAPVLLHLRRHSKTCRSVALKKQLKSLLGLCDESAQSVRLHREALTQAPPAGQLLLLSAEATPLARKRTELLRLRVAEERQCVEVEVRTVNQPALTGRELKQQQRKEERAKQRGGEAGEDGEEGPTKKLKSSEKQSAKALRRARNSAAAVAEAGGANAHTDLVEEMGFSSGED